MYTIEVDETRRCAGDLMRVAQSLVSVTQALNSTKVIGVMEGKYAYQVDSSIRKAQSMAIKHQKQAANLSMALTRIVAKYVEADEAAKEQIPTDTDLTIKNPDRRNLAEGSALFDDKGGYGGDQGDLASHHRGKNIFGWVIGGDKAIYDLIRTYPGYENYTDGQISDLLNKINVEGCGYVAVINSIFMQYESDPAKFERTFGFPMYDENGELNYNRFLLDFYLSTDDKFYLDEKGGMNGLVSDVFRSYKNRPEDFARDFGVELYDDNGNYNVDAMQAVTDRYQNQSVAEFEANDGTTVNSLENRLSHYLKDKGAPFISRGAVNSMTAADVQRELDNGKSVNILITDFNLYNEGGRTVRKDVGGHWMTITGVTDSGNYIVSSWGKQFVIHPSEIPQQTMLVIDANR